MRATTVDQRPSLKIVPAEGAPAPADAPMFDSPAEHDGLSSDEARRRLAKDGPNAMPDTSAHPWRDALAKLWAPVPWMLEAATILELVLSDYAEAAIIAGLVVSNAGLGLFQESRAQAPLAALKSRLALTATVRRDGRWAVLPAAGIVAGDLIKL